MIYTLLFQYDYYLTKYSKFEPLFDKVNGNNKRNDRFQHDFSKFIYHDDLARSVSGKRKKLIDADDSWIITWKIVAACRKKFSE